VSTTDIMTMIENGASDPEVYEPRIQFEEVYFEETLRCDEALDAANRRQAAWDSDPEEFETLHMEHTDGWVGACAE